MNLISLVRTCVVSGFVLICSNAYSDQGIPYSATSSPLDDGDQRRHIQTVLMALNMTQAGETSEWYNPRSNSSGLVQVVASANTGSGYCRVFLSKVNKNGDIRLFKETACVQIDHKGWIFYK